LLSECPVIAPTVDIESKRASLASREIALENLSQQIELFEVGYRAGDFDTERMLAIWERRKTFGAEIESLRAEKKPFPNFKDLLARR